MKTILYAEDDQDDFDFFLSVINHIDPDIKCVRAEDCGEVAGILEETLVLPHYIFLDINMPKMNGIDCLVKVVSDERYSKIPIIMYSTGRNQEEVLKCKKLGARDYIFKASSFKDSVRDLKKYFVSEELQHSI